MHKTRRASHAIPVLMEKQFDSLSEAVEADEIILEDRGSDEWTIRIEGGDNLSERELDDKVRLVGDSLEGIAPALIKDYRRRNGDRRWVIRLDFEIP